MFITAMYKLSLVRKQLHISLRLQAKFESIILLNRTKVLPTLLGSLDEPFFMDVKLAMVKMLLPRIQFVYVDKLIDKL